MGEKAGSACLDENALIDIAQGRVKASALTDAEHHLATCDDCSETLAALAGIVNPAAPTTPMAPATGVPLSPGTILNDTYRLLRLIGQGGMGDVYEAAHLRLEGRRAIKVLNSDPSEAAQTVPRFMREAGIASALRHANIVQVVDFNVTSDGRPFLVMEYLDGLHFGELIRNEAPMSLSRVLQLITPIASVLEAMHRRGIVHRDLKPQNIMLVTDGENGSQVVKVLDFGLAKRAGPPGKDSLALSRGRTLLGTPMYMAPEQAVGDLDSVGPAADQFALGSLVYEMLTKRQPFYAETTAQVLYRVISVEPMPLRSLVPEVPAHAEAAVLRSLAKDPPQRFPMVRDFLDALATASSDKVAVAARSGAAPTSVASGALPVPDRRPRITGARAIALLLVLLAAGTAVRWKLRPTQARVRDSLPSATVSGAESSRELHRPREGSGAGPVASDDGADEGPVTTADRPHSDPSTLPTTLRPSRAAGKVPRTTAGVRPVKRQVVPVQDADATTAKDRTPAPTAASAPSGANAQPEPGEPIDLFEVLKPPEKPLAR